MWEYSGFHCKNWLIATITRFLDKKKCNEMASIHQQKKKAEEGSQNVTLQENLHNRGSIHIF